MREEKYLVSSYVKLYLDLRQSKGYTDELEKLSKDDSYLTLTVKLQDPDDKTMRLKVTGYFQGEYYNKLFDKCLLIMYKDYVISKQKDITT